MTGLNCPEGIVKLPIDLWYCKLVDKPCPNQAHIDTENWDAFHRHCLAPADRQTGIRQAITTGKYSGFHHMPGKHLCPLCKPSRSGRWERVYHYEWELFPLDQYTPYDSETLALELIKHEVPRSALAGYLCRDCLNDVLKQLDLPTQNGLFDHRGYGEPMNDDEPVSFHMYRSVIEKASGNDFREGSCAWCAGSFGWNAAGESIYYDIHSITSPTGNRDGFRLCERCGDRFATLFTIAD